MFRGINAVNLDVKGRLVIPSRYRDRLSELSQGHVVVTIDTESTCLLLYPLPTWEAIESKLQALPSFDPKVRRIQRLLIGHATDVEMDSAGRLLLPPPLREYAGLDKHVVLIGQGSKFEIWDETQWQAGRELWMAEEQEGSGGLSEELKLISL